MLSRRPIWISLSLILLTHVQAEPDAEFSRHPSRVLVKLKSNAGRGKFITRPVMAGEAVDDAIARLRAMPDVLFAEPDWRVSGTVTIPNDTSFSSQWAIANTKTDLAWDISRGSAGVRVCIVDSGVDFDHPDLAGQMDPVYGKGKNAISPGRDAMDDNGHGTHVAGIIGAATNNGKGISGMNWAISLVPCKFLDSSNNGYISNAIACLDYCHYTVGAKISSHSWGAFGSNFRSLSDKMAEISAAGFLVVAAAGNSAVDNDRDRNKMLPASYSYDGIISVAAIEDTDTLASYSNFGAKSVDLAAPGSIILSTDLNGGYSYSSGTSFSAPHVTGAAALLSAAKPGITAAQIKAAILGTARKLPSLNRKCVSGGTLDVEAALKFVRSMR